MDKEGFRQEMRSEQVLDEKIGRVVHRDGRNSRKVE